MVNPQMPDVHNGVGHIYNVEGFGRSERAALSSFLQNLEHANQLLFMETRSVLDTIVGQAYHVDCQDFHSVNGHPPSTGMSSVDFDEAFIDANKRHSSSFYVLGFHMVTTYKVDDEQMRSLQHVKPLRLKDSGPANR